MADKKKKVSMVVFSGDMDKLVAAFTIATGAAASGMDVTMFFTFWGLRAIRKNKKTGKSFFGKLLGLFYGGGLSSAAPSKFSFGGMGRWMFKKMMQAKKVPSLEELRKMALEMGVKLYGCQMSMSVMEIPKAVLIDEVDSCVGVAFFIDQAQESDVSLFI